MRTQEVENVLGITKQTILFYEKEGLLTPTRDSNGYRNYVQEDIQVLRLVKLLRSMDISIDDIKGILDGTLSFQECLKIKERKVENTLHSLQEMKDTITELKGKNIPMIPALVDIDITSYPFTLGFKKTNKTVSLGRKLTSRQARKMMLMNVLGSAIITTAFMYGMRFWASEAISMDTAILVFLLFILIGNLSGFQIRAYWIDMSHNQYIEFLEDEVCYYTYRGIAPNFLYIWKVLLGHGDSCLRRCKYEDIDKMIIRKKERYMKIPGTNLSTMMDNYDYEFVFTTGDTLYLNSPMILDDDGYYLAHIAKAKIANIQDVEEVLDSFIS